ncbi:MAG: bis-aminopropyl spermidine synthase family protein [Deltaproteobacteria bacterium]|nr:bis-aminopropyl spermidine synthase family protein [Deltaproteobacteria bacterium]
MSATLKSNKKAQLVTPLEEGCNPEKKRGQDRIDVLNLQSSGLDKDPRFLDWIKLLQKQRPNAKRNLDQFPATVDTLQKRVALLKRFVSRGPTLFLGDFDLTALALGYHHPRTELTVIDIDQDLLNFISQAASTHDLLINTI